MIPTPLTPEQQERKIRLGKAIRRFESIVNEQVPPEAEPLEMKHLELLLGLSAPSIVTLIEKGNPFLAINVGNRNKARWKVHRSNLVRWMALNSVDGRSGN